MTGNDQASDVASYAASVRAALSDLPSDQGEVLLEDLEDHLREIAADAGGPLAERLGPPGQYAQELRTAYGAAHVSSERQGPALRDLQLARTWVTDSEWYRSVRAFLPELRPAWWVLRGYLAALILTVGFSPGYNLGPIPDPTTKRGLAEILVAGVAIWLSVRIGRRSRTLPQGPRFLAVSANILIALVAVVVLGSMHRFVYSELIGTANPEQPPFAAAFAAGPVTNIYPYSQDGKPLTNVLLFDQDGRPLTLDKLPDGTTNYPIGADGQPITNAYPLNQRRVDGTPVVQPRVAIPPWPAVTPSASPTATPGPSPTH